MTGITVAIPVGPFSTDQQWLEECLASVQEQTCEADEILLIDDMAGLKLGPSAFSLEDGSYLVDDMRIKFGGCRIWKSPWRLGVAHAFNFGVALAENELVFMLGADDTLHPECLERCAAAYEKDEPSTRDLTYYFVGVQYLDGRVDDKQFVPCNAAMVTKSLWQRCGGFAVESASGAPDAALISVMMVHPEAGRFTGVGEGMCLYNYRPHTNTDTAKRGAWQGVILETRNVLTRDWKQPEWGRYA